MKTNDLPQKSQQLQDLGEGVVKFGLHRGTIMVYTVSELTKKAMANLVVDMIETLDEWSPNKPYLLMVDVSQCTPNKLSRQQAIQISTYRPEITGRMAIMISNSVQWQVTRYVLESALLEKGRERRLFTDRQDAMRWLRAAVIN